MQAHLTRCGSSLGLRIPKTLAGRFRLTEGMCVTLEPDGDRIIISMPPRYSLDSFLADITPDSMHDAFDWGVDQGREIVDRSGLRTGGRRMAPRRRGGRPSSVWRSRVSL